MPSSDAQNAAHNDAPDFVHHLLDERLIGVQRQDGSRVSASLPEVLAGLGAGEIDEFTAIRPHQFHAWHAFLVQVATLVARQQGDQVCQRTAEQWRDALVRLGGGRPEPWALVVEALDAPAFLQPPVPEGSMDPFRKSTAFPDKLDIILTAKNHDIKSQRMKAATPEHWMYALVTLQTMEGYSGAKNYGIARMNGGFGNRPSFALSKSDSWADRFQRDTSVWLDAYDQLLADHGYAPDGLGLLWLDAWDGASSLPIRSCQPAFIEVCRRVRLLHTQDRIVAHIGSSKVARLGAEEGGVSGDIWTPVQKEQGKALTPSRVTLGYRKLSGILFGDDFEPGAALRLRSDDGDSPVFIGRALVRGQGKSEGLHERIVVIPPKARGLFGRQTERAGLGTAAKRRIEHVRQVESRLLKPALLALAQGGADHLRLDDDRMGVWLREFDSQVDAQFFAMLFDSIDQDPSEADAAWISFLLTIARSVLTDAERSVAIPSIHRPRAVAMAWRLFEGGARKHFPDLFTKPEGGTDEKRDSRAG